MARFLHGSRLLAAWLGLLLAVAVVLAFAAFRAERSHREVARQALANYAQVGATGLVERLQVRFGAYTCVALAGQAVNLEASGAGPAVDPRELERTAPPRGRDALAAVREIRRVPLAGDAAGTSGTAGEDAAIVRTLGDRARDAAGSGPDWGAVLREDLRFAYWLVRAADGAPAAAWIFRFEPDALREELLGIVAVAPVLPRFLLHGDAAPAWLRWRLEGTDGSLLAGEPGPLAGDFTAHEAAPPVLDGMVARVRIDPGAAPALVAGGVPPSTLPWMLALLALAVALLAFALVQLRREAATARLREDFLASVSHELRTPLANIRLSAETVRLGRVRDAAERDHALEVAERESERLTHLVDNVLLASRAGRGALTAELRPVDVGALAEDTAASFRAFAAARGMDLRCRAAPGLRVHADAFLLRQAVSNLLDNAVKYGPKGQEIVLVAARAGADVALAVEDHGPGVPVAERERVWERFFRLDRDRGSATAGSGLGLAVVKDIAALHHGTASVEEREGGGARFVLRIPATPAEGAAP